jgi:predicted DNA binding protein
VKKFFTKWFYISLILIISSILFVEIFSKQGDEIFIVTVVANTISSIGIAIFVANIFTFTIGTEEFLQFIRERLIKIVISKDFITRLSSEEQKSLLGMVLKPSRELAEIYSGINDYFDQYVEDSMTLFDNCYRGHMRIEAVASFNKEVGRVEIHYDYDYVMYKTADQFDELPVWFENENHEHIRTIVAAKAGDWEEIPSDLIKKLENIEDPTMVKGYSMSVPDKFNEFNHVNISRKVCEAGNDHWQIFSFKTIKPCDQLTVSLRCEDGLVIKDSNIYGIQDKFSIEKEKQKIRVRFTDWLSPGFGVNIMVAKENFHFPENQ